MILMSRYSAQVLYRTLLRLLVMLGTNYIDRAALYSPCLGGTAERVSISMESELNQSGEGLTAPREILSISILI